jgi:hypothetical protein
MLITCAEVWLENPTALEKTPIGSVANDSSA